MEYHGQRARLTRWNVRLTQEELMSSSRDSAGYVDGKHFTEYVEDVKDLKRAGDMDSAEPLLLRLVDATESECAVDGWGVAPWYYEQLAIVYRRQRLYDKEVAILERFAAQKHAPGVTPGQLMERLSRARALHEETLS
jgi:hypothetical protein